MPLSLDDARRLADERLQPGRFFAPGRSLACRHVAAETSRWEVFQGRLLDHTQTRQEATLEAWNLDEPGASEPLLSLKLDATAGRLFVVRGIDNHVWEAHAEGNVITTRPARRRVRELIAAFDLAAFASAEELGEELSVALSRAVTGTRLPLMPVEAPHPAFSFGELFHGPDAGAGPPTSWDELLGCWLAPAATHRGLTLPARLSVRRAEPGLPRLSRLLEVWLRAMPAEELPRAAVDLQQRWAALGQGAGELLHVLRVLFDEVSLSPWTDLIDKVLRLLALLEQGGLFSAADVIDFESYLLRLVGRHLTAYDLVTFHHRGANYPDALLLDAVLTDYLARLELTRGLFEGEAGRRRRRALRQAYLVRHRYEGHLVPDVPTSPGEHARVFPDHYPRVPEEQLLQPASRKRRLYAGAPLAQRLGPTSREVLRQAVADLDHPAEIQELGAAVFLDRPFGGGKAPVEPDNTLLLASLAYSRSLAHQRLRLLVRDLGLADAKWQRLDERLALPGLGLEAIGPAVRSGTLGLIDAARAGPDFVFRHTLPGSVRALIELFDFGPLEAHLSGQALLARDPAGPGLIVRDANWRPILTLEPRPERGFASRRGLEYPADGLVVTALDGAPLPEPVPLPPR